MKVMKFLLVTALITLVCLSAYAGNRSDDPLEVAVSPQTLLLSSVQGGSVAVHTDIPLSSVDVSTVTLDGLSPTYVKADACGDIVAFFDEAEVKAMVAPPSAVLTFSGCYVDGTAFSGSDSVRVVE